MREKARPALLVGLIGIACGPSLATVHEGAVRFEHCYGIDLDPRAQAEQRKACWQLWVASYTVGQPRDRIEYAQRRLRALAGEDTDCPKLALDREQAPEERKFYLVVPGPTSVHAPPPPIAPVVPAPDAGAPLDAAVATDESAKTTDGKLATEGAKTSAAKTSDAGSPPAERCASGCRSAWESCDASCGPGTPQCTQCKNAYSNCMRSCFD
jgi:hypothetical protein